MSIAEFPEHEELSENDFPEERSAERLTSRRILENYLDTRDEAIFGALCERYRQSTVHYLQGQGVRSAADRDDLVQDIFTIAFRKIDQLRDTRSFGGWLRAIARSTMINAASRGNRHQHISLSSNYGTIEKTDEKTDMDMEDLREDLPEENLLFAEMKEKVRRAIAYLKPLDAQTLRQFYFERMALKEMAAHNEVPIGTIKRRLFTARKRVAVLLSHYMKEDTDQSGLGIVA